MEDRILTKKQVAEKYQVTTQSISQYMKKGLPYYKLNSRMVRFNEAEVSEWFEKNKK